MAITDTYQCIMAAVMKNNFYLFIFIYLGVGGGAICMVQSCWTPLQPYSVPFYKAWMLCEVACKPPLCLSCEPRQIPCFSFWSPLISKHTSQTRADQQENVKRRPHLHQQCFSSHFFSLFSQFTLNMVVSYLHYL